VAVRVNIHHYFWPEGDGTRVTAEVSSKTLLECLGEIAARFPQLKNEILDPAGNLQGHIMVLLNGVDVPPDDITQTVSDSDIIEIIPIIGGG
jgi:sulfur carrier protein ThiS